MIDIRAAILAVTICLIVFAIYSQAAPRQVSRSPLLRHHLQSSSQAPVDVRVDVWLGERIWPLQSFRSLRKHLSEEDEVFFRITRPIVGVFAVGVILWFALALLALLIVPASAHDGDPSHDEWYMSLRQPDNPTASCCGIADAYWCDDISVKDGKTFCAITDDREIAGRPSLPMGLKVEIPDRKLKWDRGNPTGHAIVFLSSGGAVYCFVQGGGV